MLNSYQELKVWQKSVELVIEIYRLTKKEFQKSEELINEIMKMLNSLINTLVAKP